DVEQQAVVLHPDVQRIRAARMANRGKAVVLDQIFDRDRAFAGDATADAPHRAAIQRDGDEAALAGLCDVFSRRRRRTAGVVMRGGRHLGSRRRATEGAGASSPSASPSAMAYGPSAACCSGPHLRIEVRFMKSSTPRPDENRAERAVGRTWLEPPT